MAEGDSEGETYNVFDVDQNLRRKLTLSQKAYVSLVKDDFGTPDVVKNMKLSYHLTKPDGSVQVMNFNKRGDLLCTGCSHNEGKCNNIGLLDWAEIKVKATMNIENNGRISDINFIAANQACIVSVYENGRFRCDSLTPTGLTEALQSQQLSVERQKLAICPESQHEVLSASSSGNLFHIDIRSSEQIKKAANILEQAYTTKANVKLQSISHHPLRPQLCASFDDYHVRTFDKRKFDRPLHEICPTNLNCGTNSKPAQISDCFYNYDGSEILAIYTDTEIYLFDSENKQPGEFKQSYSQFGYLGGFTNKTCFFGPKSEYVVIGDDGERIAFVDKVTGKDVGLTALWPHGRWCSVYFLDLKSHPNLPIVAAAASHFSILSPKSDEEDTEEADKRKIRKSEKKAKNKPSCSVT